jgi:hypothetical protein
VYPPDPARCESVVAGLGPSVPRFAMSVKHCQASDGFRGTEPIDAASSSSTDTEAVVAPVGAGGLEGTKTTGPGYVLDGGGRFSELDGLVDCTSGVFWAGGFVFGVKFLILFLRIRRPPRFEPPKTHSRRSRIHRWHGGTPGLPLASLLYSS